MTTQKEMAAVLGVSQALVSRALSGRAAQIGASPRTVARIRRLAAQRGYQPHPAALVLRGAPTRVLGVVVRDFEDPYFGRLIGCLQAAAGEHGVSLLLTGKGRDEVAALQRQRVDGVILAGSDFPPAYLRRALGADVPLVQLGTGAAYPGACLVGLDESDAIALLVAHLRSLGHRSIGFAGMVTAAHRRRAALVRAVTGRRGAKGPVFMDVTPAALVEKIALLRRSGAPDRPTAFIAGDDLLALALNAGLAARGLRVPHDLSLAGIDDIPASSLGFPALTTVAQPMREMAAEALRLLARGGAPEAPRARLFRGQLVVRHSCAAVSP